MKDSIIIIGGGISGITTALTLQLLGYDTTCYAEHLVNEDTERDSRFASLFPAASVIPHSVETDLADILFPPSHTIFNFLLDADISGMQLHRHYELFEFPKDDPSYARFLDGYQRIDGKPAGSMPKRPDAESLHGWMFDCIVTEWPVYIQHLYHWYAETGGKLVKKKIYPEALPGLPAEYIVNCSGIWAPELFRDPEPRLVVRGHLLHVPGAPLIRDEDEHIVSYNYTPLTSVYADPDGNPSDVYFYPRQDGWVLGGSRQTGTISPDGSFEGREHKNTITINEIDVPEAIYHLNKIILDATFGRDLPQASKLTAQSGYRYVRSMDNGLRLDTSEEWGKKIIHNYGHGGAGVTLSWGCALYVFELIQDITGTQPGARSTAPVDRLRDQLRKLSLN